MHNVKLKKPLIHNEKLVSVCITHYNMSWPTWPPSGNPKIYTKAWEIQHYGALMTVYLL
jgi:hypothetical protein